MDNIVITARHEGDGFETYLGPSLTKFNTKCINVADTTDSSKLKTISHKYREGIDLATRKSLLTNDTMVILAKSNVHIIDPLYVEKVSMIFESKPNVGVIGVLGVKEVHSGRSMYEKDNLPHNGIIYTVDIEADKGEQLQYSKSGFYDNIVGVDDSIIAIRGSLLIDGSITIESDTDEGFGIEISIKNILAGFDTVVADIMVVSETNTNHDHTVVDSIISLLNLSYPIKSSTLGEKVNSVVDIDI